MKFKLYAAVAAGGGVGATLRYTSSFLISNARGFPFHTLVVNLIGCFLLSFLYRLFEDRLKWSPVIKTALTTGVIGSFTTFSAFTEEFVQLLENSPLMAFVYMISTVVGGLFMTFLGWRCGRK